MKVENLRHYEKLTGSMSDADWVNFDQWVYNLIDQRNDVKKYSQLKWKNDWNFKEVNDMTWNATS